MADTQTAYDLMKDGGALKTALHAGVGALQAGLGGGSIVGGALGAGASEALSPATAKLPQALRPLASLGAGAAAGALGGLGGGGAMGAIAGGSAAEYGYQFNRALHPSEKKRIHEIAAAHFNELGYEHVEDAEDALRSVACAMVRCSAQVPYDQREGSPESKLEETGTYTALSRPELVSVLERSAGSFTDEFGRPKKMFGYTNETDEPNSDSYLDDRRAYGPWQSGKVFLDRCQGGLCKPAYVSNATPRDWQAASTDKSLTEHNAGTFLDFQNGLFAASGDAAANKKALESELRAKYGNDEYARRKQIFDETGALWALDSPTGLLKDPSSPHPYWSATDKAGLYSAVTGHVSDLRDYAMVETAAGRPITEADLLQRGIVLVDIDGFKQQAAMFALPILAEGVPALRRGAPPRVPSSLTDPLISTRSPATVEELMGMMNQRTGVTARVATGDTLRYLDAMGAEGSHMLMEGGQSEILLRPGASRWGAFHEWMHRSLQVRSGGPMPGEDAFIESFLERHQSLLNIQKPVGAP